MPAAQGRRPAAALAAGGDRRTTERPRSLTVGAGRPARPSSSRTATPPTSGVLDLGTDGAAPERLTTGRELDAVLGGHAAAPLARRRDRRLRPTGATSGSCPPPAAPPRKLVEGGGPVWLDDARLLVSIEREIETVRTTRWPSWTSPTRGRGGSRATTATSTRYGDEGEPDRLARRRARSRTSSSRAPTSSAREIRVVDSRPARVRALTGHAAACTTPAPPGRPTARRSPTRPSARAATSCTSSAATATTTASSRATTPTSPELALAPGRRRGSLAVRGPAQPLRPRASSTRPTGAVEEVAPRAAPGPPRAGRPRARSSRTYEDHATPPELRRSRPARPHRTSTRPRRSRSRARAHVAPEEVSFRSFDGLEIPAFLFRPATPRRSARSPAVVYPHGGPTDAYIDDWDGHAQYFVDKGYAWLAPNFRGSTGYGRDFERLNHGVWGVDDTKDCLAAADYLRTLDWVDGERLGIFGASYGSYMALLAVTDDPEHRFRCAVGQVRRLRHRHLVGAGRPRRRPGPRADDGPARRRAREAYRAGSPFHRLPTSRRRCSSPTASATSA